MENRIYMVITSRVSIINSIIDAEICDTLEGAFEYGKNIIKDNCFNRSKIDLDTEEDYINYLNDIKEDHNVEYTILISEISKDRKRFNDCKELMDYFNSNIKNISNENLYDFLLSLVNSVDTLYDYFGNILYKDITGMNFKRSPLVYHSDIDFNEEGCKKGIYTFNYK